MKKIKLLAMISIAILSLVLLTGCSGDNETSQETQMRVVQTSKGEVEIPASPSRIVDISGSSE